MSVLFQCTELGLVRGYLTLRMLFWDPWVPRGSGRGAFVVRTAARREMIAIREHLLHRVDRRTGHEDATSHTSTYHQMSPLFSELTEGIRLPGAQGVKCSGRFGTRL